MSLHLASPACIAGEPGAAGLGLVDELLAHEYGYAVDVRREDQPVLRDGRRVGSGREQITTPVWGGICTVGLL